jgi:hypothetical protein
MKQISNIEGVLFQGQRVAYCNQIVVEGYNVLAEDDLVVEITIGGEGFEGFFAFFGGLLVYGGEDATGAGFDTDEAIGAHGEVAPGFFFVGLAAGEYEVGSEAVHGKGCMEAGIEVVERGLTNDQEWVCVGQAYVLVVYLISGVYGAGVFFGEVHEFTGKAEAPGEPGAVRGVYFVGHNEVIPDLYGPGCLGG